MRTTVTLDDALLAQAHELCGPMERSALLKEALRFFVQREAELLAAHQPNPCLRLLGHCPADGVLKTAFRRWHWFSSAFLTNPPCHD